jgi:hypothetical protein
VSISARSTAVGKDVEGVAALDALQLGGEFDPLL